MMKRFVWKLGAFTSALVLCGSVGAPVSAQSVEDKIKTLESELTQLKEQQIELKKEATAAAAAMPSFSYRPGNGLNIEAADKSWSFRTSLESHFRLNFVTGRDETGRTQGEVEGRRFRPSFFYCLNNCLWELEASLDLDGMGGGNAKNAFNTGGGSILQRGAVTFDAEKLHPWLPSVQFGMEVQNAQGGSLARQGSGSIGAQAEYDLHTANNGFNTGRAGQGIVFNWDDRSLSSIGIPGRLRRFQMSMASIAEGDDGLSSFSDRKDFNVYLGVQPMSQVKNKWLSGLTFDYGMWFCNNDQRGASTSGSSTAQVGSVLVTGSNVRNPGADNGCDRYRIRDNSRIGRQTMFDSGSGSIGRGLHIAHGPGIVYNVGPYTLRAMGHFQRSEDRGGSRGRKKGNSFLIGHDLFLWSPKGFLTGSATTAGSILVGTHFERVDMSVGCNGSTGIACSGGHLGQFHRNRVLLREWDLWYFIAPRMSVGASFLWYDASNLNNSKFGAGYNLGKCDNTVSGTTCRPGFGDDWVDVFLNWRYTF